MSVLTVKDCQHNGFLYQQVNLDADAPRVADLKFQLEKRDGVIADLEATVAKLNVCNMYKNCIPVIVFRMSWKR